MNDQDLKKLAKVTIQGKNVDKKISTFVLNNLTRKQLLTYLRYLKTLAAKNSVRILSGQVVPTKLKNEIIKKFKGKDVIFEQDDKITEGIIAIDQDTIIDLSLSGYLSTTIGNLKN